LTHAGNTDVAEGALDGVRASVAEVVQADKATSAVGRAIADHPAHAGIATLVASANEAAAQRLTHTGDARLVGGTRCSATVLLAHSEDTSLISGADVGAALGQALAGDTDFVNCAGGEAARLETSTIDAGLIGSTGSKTAGLKALAGDTGLVGCTGAEAARLETRAINAGLVSGTGGEATCLKALAGDAGLIRGTAGKAACFLAHAEDTGLVDIADGIATPGDTRVVDANLGAKTRGGSAQGVLSAHIVHAALIGLADNSSALGQTLAGGANLAGLADSEATSRLAGVGYADLGVCVTNVNATQRLAEVVLAKLADSTLTRACAVSLPEADAAVAGLVAIAVQLVVARRQANAGATKLTSQAVGVEQASPLCNAHVALADLAGSTFDIKRASRVRWCLAEVVEADLSESAETRACAQAESSPEADAALAVFVEEAVRLCKARGQAQASAASLSSQAVGAEQASPLCNAHVVVADRASSTLEVE
jgi:hypothetical protein